MSYLPVKLQTMPLVRYDVVIQANHIGLAYLTFTVHRIRQLDEA